LHNSLVLIQQESMECFPPMLKVLIYPSEGGITSINKISSSPIHCVHGIAGEQSRLPQVNIQTHRGGWEIRD